MRSLNIPVPGWQKVMARLYLGWSKPKRPILGHGTGRGSRSGRPEGNPLPARRCDFRLHLCRQFWRLCRNTSACPKTGCWRSNRRISHTRSRSSSWRRDDCPAMPEKRKNPARSESAVYGASGAVGTNAVQLASRHFGADVTGVCSTANLELVKRWGQRGSSITLARISPKTAKPMMLIFDAVGKLLLRRKLKRGSSRAAFTSTSTSTQMGVISSRIYYCSKK
jgi:hypothetical protein